MKGTPLTPTFAADVSSYSAASGLRTNSSARPSSPAQPPAPHAPLPDSPAAAATPSSAGPRFSAGRAGPRAHTAVRRRSAAWFPRRQQPRSRPLARSSPVTDGPRDPGGAAWGGTGRRPWVWRACAAAATVKPHGWRGGPGSGGAGAPARPSAALPAASPRPRSLPQKTKGARTGGRAHD